MASPPDDRDKGDAANTATFIHQLPKRIAAIEDIWARLAAGSWDATQFDALYERIREISEASKALSLFQLNESVFSLEVYLSSFVGADITPNTNQLDAIAGLLRALKTAANVTAAAAQQQQGAAAAAGVFILGDPDGLTAGLADALRGLGCDVHYFPDTEGLLEELQANQPKVIVADTVLLPQMPPLSAELIRLRSQTSVEIPLIFVSDSTALQLRVDAIRAGGDGYFVAPLDNAAVAAQIRDMATPVEQTPYRVLVVEDDPAQAEFAASIMQKAGIEVMQVLEPIKLIDSLRSFRPDLILMDIYMPDINGIELTTIIRDHREFVAIPIIFLSGEQNTDKQLDALSVGGDDFIAKPIRPKHLLGIVQTRIRRARQLISATGQPPKHDRVTGLFSRQHFLDRIARLVGDQTRTTPVGIIVLRPDRLDDLQERLGIGGIDHLLSEFGALIGGQLQEVDLAARLDDDSLGVLLRRDNEAAILELAKGMLAKISAHRFPDGLRSTASIGLCFIDGQIEDANGVINRARSACGEAAAQGGDRVHTYSSEDKRGPQPPQPGDDDLVQRIKLALHHDAFITQYQPMLDLQTRGSENYEIVLRLENAEGDLIGGRQLHELAEAADVAPQLDQWILERAVDILKQRRDSGRRTRIFVHQSAHSALDKNMPAWLAGRLRAKHMVGTGLVVDFGLPDLSNDLTAAQHNIKALREMDVEVSLSRFPEKDAAFKVLRFLHAQYINIAPRLLKADRQIISSVIHQAHEASAKVIVSNVDDPRSIDLHWSSGADYLQGNFIQRPLENMDYDFSQVVI